MVDQLFLSNTYEFDSQNNLTISGIVMGKIISKFEIDRKNKRIKVAEAKKDPDFWNYEFENNILKVEMPTEKGFIKLSFVKE